MRPLRRRSVVLLAGLPVLAWLAGCAQPARSKDGISPDAAIASAYTGRLSLRVDSEPVQTFAALFDLSGTASTGELILTTPIGNTLAAMRWSPGEAVLKNGADTRYFDSVGALIEAATGATSPVGALLSWLAGRDESVAGWRADLSQIGTGRLQATRAAPMPAADLRLVFERQ